MKNMPKQHSLGGFESTASAVAAIARDPSLPVVAGLILELKALEKDSSSSPGSPGKGIGLRNVVGPLRTYVKIQKNPWVLLVAVTGVFGLVFAAGYYTRKATK